MAQSTTIPHRTRRLAPLVCLVIAVQTFASAVAKSPLEYVPADVSGVVALQRPALTAERITEFARRVEPGYAGLDWTLLSDAMDLWPDCWDQTKPVVFVMTKPSFDFLTDPEFGDSRAVFVFTPKDPDKFKKLLRNREETAQRIERAGRRYYVMMRDGYVFYAGHRRSLRGMRRVRPESSLYASLDPHEKRTLEESDVFVHLPLAAWSDRLNFLALLATNMARVGAVEQDPGLAAASRAMFDYLGSGIRNIIGDMQTLTLAMSYDGDALRLVHHHSFHNGGGVSEYLANVKRTGFKPYDLVPDRPFFMVGAFDWRTPAEDAISVRLMNHLFAQDLGEGTLSPKIRRDLKQVANACYDQINGSFFAVLPSVNDRLSPITLIGGYAVRDSDVALKQMRLLQDKAAHLSSGFVSGMYPGEFKRSTIDGVQLDEMKIALDQMPQSVRQQLVTLYGDDVRLQEMKLGTNLVLHTVSSGSASVLDMVSAQKSGKSLLNNAAVSRLRKQLPQDPHGVMIFDLGRSFAVLPHFVLEAVEKQMSPESGKQPPSTRNTYKDSNGTGPLLGWSCTVSPTSLTGCFVISADDAILAAEHAKAAVSHISDVLAGAKVGRLPLAAP